MMMLCIDRVCPIVGIWHYSAPKSLDRGGTAGNIVKRLLHTFP